jgi:serine/threonine protein kinase
VAKDSIFNASSDEGGAVSNLTRTGLAIGTAGYMSPEQVKGEKLDARTDLFSFGLVLYEMATGHRAFGGKTAAEVHNAILNQAQPPVRNLNSTLSPGLETVINKSLEKDRDLRYQSAAELRADLEKKLRGSLKAEYLGSPAGQVPGSLPASAAGADRSRKIQRNFGIAIAAASVLLSLPSLSGAVSRGCPRSPTLFASRMIGRRRWPSTAP